MSERYFAKVLRVESPTTVVINAGSSNGVEVDSAYLIVGLGDMIKDPDSGEEIEQLEVVRGRAKAVHVQERIATLESTEYEKSPDEREIKKVTAGGGRIASLMGPQETTTESIKPGPQRQKPFKGVQEGDLVISR